MTPSAQGDQVLFGIITQPAATKVDESLAMLLLRVSTLEAVGVASIADGDPIIHKIFSRSKCTLIDHGIQCVAI